eukprot:scaffold4692_cov118-Isochrysis_galbana.AAC.2
MLALVGQKPVVARGRRRLVANRAGRGRSCGPAGEIGRAATRAVAVAGQQKLHADCDLPHLKQGHSFVMEEAGLSLESGEAVQPGKATYFPGCGSRRAPPEELSATRSVRGVFGDCGGADRAGGGQRGETGSTVCLTLGPSLLETPVLTGKNPDQLQKLVLKAKKEFKAIDLTAERESTGQQALAPTATEESLAAEYKAAGWPTGFANSKIKAASEKTDGLMRLMAMVNVGKEMGTLTRTLEKKLEEAHKVPGAARMPVLLPIVQAIARSSKRQLGGNDEEGQSQSHSNAVLSSQSEEEELSEDSACARSRQTRTQAEKRRRGGSVKSAREEGGVDGGGGGG